MTTIQSASETLTAVVSPRSLGPQSLFEASEQDIISDPCSFSSSPEDIRHAVKELQRLGFSVHSTSESTISISGDKQLFQDVFSRKFRKEKAETAPGEETEFFSAAGDKPVMSPPGDLANLIEGIAMARPPTYFAASPIPPLAPIANNAYRYLFAPDDIAVMLRATRTHRTGASGRGLTVAMPDTGFGNGHGTGEAANVFATAPDVILQPVKMGDPIDAIKLSRNSGAKVISNSWGYSVDVGSISWATLDPYLKALAQEIQLAINAGITVCFAAGNGHYAFPASMPSVIAVGGVHINYPDLTFEAANYASSFASKIYPGRKVPDVCGLTGKKVIHNGGGYAPSIMLPVPPNSTLDSIWPATGAAGDGWGIFSGTSAACPQIAGICALMLEKDGTLTPAQIKANLKQSARDVQAGSSAQGDVAGVGPDNATGAGLADAKWAYLISMSGIASRFFNATQADKVKMLSAGELPQLPPEFMEDLMETLRSV